MGWLLRHNLAILALLLGVFTATSAFAACEGTDDTIRRIQFYAYGIKPEALVASVRNIHSIRRLSEGCNLDEVRLTAVSALERGLGTQTLTSLAVMEAYKKICAKSQPCAVRAVRALSRAIFDTQASPTQEAVETIVYFLDHFRGDGELKKVATDSLKVCANGSSEMAFCTASLQQLTD